MRPARYFSIIQLSNSRADAAARKLFSLSVFDCSRIPGGGYGREEKLCENLSVASVTQAALRQYAAVLRRVDSRVQAALR